MAGATVKAGDGVADVSDLGTFQVALNVGEMDVSQLAVGGRAEITVDAFPDATFSGEISAIAPSAGVQSGVVLFPVTVRLEPAGVPLRSGMSATVAMVTAEVADALIVPVQAVETVGDQSFVQVLPAAAAAKIVATLVGSAPGAFGGQRPSGTFPAQRPAAAGVPGDGSVSGAEGVTRPQRAGFPGGFAGSNGGASGSGANRNGNGAAAGFGQRGSRTLTVPLDQVAASLERVPVTLGLTADTQVQVLSGLSEGDRVVVTTTPSTTSSTTNSDRGGGFGFGVPFGGPPGGR